MGARIAAGALACAVWTSISLASPPALPAQVRALMPNARLQGSGELRSFGLSIYDGAYWSAERGYSLARPFALDLHYRRDLSGARIALRSVDEVAQLGWAAPTNGRVGVD